MNSRHRWLLFVRIGASKPVNLNDESKSLHAIAAAYATIAGERSRRKSLGLPNQLQPNVAKDFSLNSLICLGPVYVPERAGTDLLNPGARSENLLL